ncbi:multidrug resistance-associated ABC transporter [Mycena floridula]|nr:multidrug resistance-associated ABC transporter [Mycena floridula]
MWNPFRPLPAPANFAQGALIPDTKASLLSKLSFQWLSPFLGVGYSRPLEKEDLWDLPRDRHADKIAEALQISFYSRCPPENRPGFLRDILEENEKGNPVPQSSDSDSEKAVPKSPVQPQTGYWFTRKTRPKLDSSLVKAINNLFFYRIWGSALLKLGSDTLNTTAPLVNKVLLTWLVESYQYYHIPEEARASLPAPRGIGYGIGLAFALFSMQELSSLMNNHYMQICGINGLYIRTSIIGAVFRKSLRLSGRGRLEHNTGQTTTMISNDATRLDRFSSFGHVLWAAPIQVAIGIGLLIGNLGYSALVGLAVLILAFPIQVIIVKQMFSHSKKAITITDQRLKTITEILQGIRLVKFYAWEDFYLKSINTVRAKEISELRKLVTWRSVLIAIITWMPVLAAVLSFITYSLTKHDLNVAIIFSSLQLFNIIRAPLMFFPFVLSILSDTLVSLVRISKYLTAEELPDPYPIDPDQKHAVVVDGDFTWEAVPKEKAKEEKGDLKKGPAKKQKKKDKAETILPTTKEKSDDDTMGGEEDDKPFELTSLNFKVPRGSFIGIVGRIGSGCSSILQAIIGEMRKTKGEVQLGGSIGYVPQTAWIRNATLRDNILFGSELSENKLRKVIKACSLEHDLDVLPHGEDTEIGEKGINLSGGQKTRISLARAAYSSADIVLLDDPLSAVDAYVGNAILEDCILSGPLADRTRILTTHALHVLDKTDYIYVIDHGRITEQGTFKDLISDSSDFARLMEEYGHSESGEVKVRAEKAPGAIVAVEDPVKDDKALMQEEERALGSVSWAVYGSYFRFSGGIFWAPILLILLILTQGAQVGNTLFLGFWTAQSIKSFHHQSQYMALYAGLGAAQAFFSFLLSFILAMTALSAAYNIFQTSLTKVLRSPVSFFDTTPLGRIMSRMSKDQDTIDKDLIMTVTQLMLTGASVFGTIGLVFYVFPLLGIIFAPIGILYYLVASYYRRSSVETKRLDSLMRSSLYASFSETLTGLSTIRAYREGERSIQNAEYGLNMENRAYYMTISIQRWLGLRLDFFGSVLVLGIALFAAGYRKSVDPSKIGVVISYALGITQVFSDIVQQWALNEQNMNAVERLLVYTELPAEGVTTTPNDPPPSWPEQGVIKFKDVSLRYREDLPLVLDQISFEVGAGEKIGIVGRTGAGKSSLLQALFRIVELSKGSIEIDGHVTRDIGLMTLRSRLALVPQDSTLFMGTLRDNLDPQKSRTDAELISALQRAWLLPKDGTKDAAAEAKFSLDSTVGDDGANFSAGEKQLLALCRALVKNSRVIVLDEATSSVDVETDAKLQRTIQTEFSTSTLLCIAHRLNTIAYYDRVIVMDSGKIAEMDTVLNLFDKEDSIFRSLCNEANLKRSDILRIRDEHKGVVGA